MLRSMLYVRKGSGCRRRVTASAARPNATRSCDSIRRKPSSKFSRSPATAFSSRGAIAEDKLHPLGNELQAGRQTREQSQAGPLSRSNPKMQILGEIVVRGGLAQA